MFFFFSSRRRHTRWPRDWSSDVCSSDLVTCTDALSWISIGDRTNIQDNASVHVTHQTHPTRIGNRSEERRVGKEGRTRWWAEQEKRRERVAQRAWCGRERA